MWNKKTTKQFNTDEGFKQARPLRKLQMVDKLVRNCPVGITDKKHTRTTMRFCFRYSRIMFQKKKKKIYSVWSSDYPPAKSIFDVLKWDQSSNRVKITHTWAADLGSHSPLTYLGFGLSVRCSGKLLWNLSERQHPPPACTWSFSQHEIILAQKQNIENGSKMWKKKTPLLVGT